MTIETITPKKWIGKKKHGEIFRLQLFMAEMNLKPIDIQNDTGVTVRTITNSIYEEKPIGSKFMRELHARYGVSIDWLISGIGHMMVSHNSVAEDKQHYATGNDRAARIIAFIKDWSTYASEDEQAWLETELKFNLSQYRQYLKDISNE